MGDYMVDSTQAASTEDKVIGQGKFLKIKEKRDTYPDGTKHMLEYLDRPKPVVVVLLETEEGNLLLINQRRGVIGRSIIEAVAGSVEKGQTVEDAARAETEQEVGFELKSIKPIGGGWASPGITNEYMHFFVAKVGKHVGQKLENGEYISLVEFTPAEVRQMLRDEKITDNKTHRVLSEYFLRGMDKESSKG